MFICHPSTFTKILRRFEDVIFDSENSGIWKRRAFDKIFMNVLGVNKPLEVKFKHYRQVSNKEKLHLIIFVALVFFPDEVSDETLYDVPVFRDFF